MPFINCDWCGKLIERSFSAIKRSEHHFCNKDCHGKWDSENKVGPNASNWRGGPDITPCYWCGEPVERPKAWARRRKMAFCSRECQDNYWSEMCSGSGNPNWRGGCDDYYGKNWTKQKIRALERDNHTCQECGITREELEQEPDVHHIRPFAQFKEEYDDIEDAAKEANKLDNLISYCRSCHVKKEHEGYK